MRIGIGIGTGHGGGFSFLSVPNCTFLYSMLSGVVKDGSDRVSAWLNSVAGGSAWDLSQPTAGKRPLWMATGGKNGGPAMFYDTNRIDQLVSGAVTANQPMTVFVRATTTTTVVNQYAADGTGLNSRVLRCDGAGKFGLYAGAVLAGGAISNDVWFVGGGVFNGASSVASTNGTELTGNAGTAAASGISVGASGSGSAPWNGRIDCVVGYTGAVSAANRALIAAYMSAI